MIARLESTPRAAPTGAAGCTRQHAASRAGRRRRRQPAASVHPTVPATSRRPVALTADRHDQGHPPRRACRCRPRSSIELDGEVPRSTTSGWTNPSACSSTCRRRAPRPELVDQHAALRSDGDSSARSASAGIRTTTTRVVLDAAGVSSYSVYPLYSPYRLVIDCVTDAPTRRCSGHRSRRRPSRRCRGAWPPTLLPRESPVAVRDAALEPPPSRRRRCHGSASPPLRRGRRRRSPLRRQRPRNALTAVVTRLRRSLTAAATRPRSAAATCVSPPTATVRDDVPRRDDHRACDHDRSGRRRQPNLAGGFSMARQLGLGVSRIVIDPGHGGHDPGAKGEGTTEAELVLDVALRLEKLLAKVPGVEVILTRRTDEFVPLQERTAIANREGADLFLSIHANASTNTQARRRRNLLPEFRDQPRAPRRSPRARTRRRARRWARCRTSSRRSR